MDRGEGPGRLVIDWPRRPNAQQVIEFILKHIKTGHQGDAADTCDD